VINTNFAPFPRYSLGKVQNRYILLNLWFNPSPEGFPWDDLRKIFIERSQMAKVPNGVDTLPKISIAWVGCTNVTDRRQTTDRQTDDDI